MNTARSIRLYSQVKARSSKFYDFIEYMNTPARLRPLIYRPKNANILLTKDLKDSDNKPLRPRRPLEMPSKADFNRVLQKLKTPQDLSRLFDKWINITTRKRKVWQYFVPEHLESMVTISAFKLGCFGKTLQQLYELQPKFKLVGNEKVYDIEHWCNSVLMCRLHIGKLSNVIDARKTERNFRALWKSVALMESTTGLLYQLVLCLNRQQKAKITLPEKFQQNVQLPILEVSTTSVGKLANFFAKNRSLYIKAHTVLDFGSEDVEVRNFVEMCKAIQKKLGKPDIYKEIVN